MPPTRKQAKNTTDVLDAESITILMLGSATPARQVRQHAHERVWTEQGMRSASDRIAAHFNDLLRELGMHDNQAEVIRESDLVNALTQMIEVGSWGQTPRKLAREIVKLVKGKRITS